MDTIVSYLQNLNPAGIKAMESYRAETPPSINEFLRTGCMEEFYPEDQAEDWRELIKVITQAPFVTTPFLVYRGVSEVGQDYGEIPNFRENFVDEGLISTSLNPSQAIFFADRGYLLEISVPAGSFPALPMSALNFLGKDEEEILLPPGSFTVVGEEYREILDINSVLKKILVIQCSYSPLYSMELMASRFNKDFEDLLSTYQWWEFNFNFKKVIYSIFICIILLGMIIRIHINIEYITFLIR